MIHTLEESLDYSINGTIIDFEFIGEFQKFLDYRAYINIYPVIFGTLNTNMIKIFYVKDEEDIPELLEVMNQELKSLSRPFWAFYKQCEQGIIYNRLGIPYEFWELNEWKFESKRSAEKKYDIPNFDDPFHGDGKLVWKAWEEGNIDDCVKHNRACLLKEAEIWKRRFNLEFSFLKL